MRDKIKRELLKISSAGKANHQLRGIILEYLASKISLDLADVKKESFILYHGMSYHHIYKQMMYDLAKKCDMCNCLRCGKSIENIRDFSIDHITAWKDNPEELFFNVNNIGFSHLGCNSSAARVAHTRGRMQHISPTSKYKGVRLMKHKKKLSKPWKAEYSINNKTISLGTFATQEEAAVVYDKKMIELWGESSITNKNLGLILY